MFNRRKHSLTIIVSIALFSVNLFSQSYEWRPLGTGTSNGTNGHIYAITDFGGRIVVGGGFTSAGGVAVSNIAAWDPSTSTWSTFGVGFNDTVYSLYVYNSQLHATGSFTTSGSTNVNRIARWTGTAWEQLGSGLDDEGRTLLQYGPDLIVGGQFSNVGNGIAKWNGSSWATLGSGVDDRVFALAVFNGDLIAAGRFQIAGGIPASNIARWNSAWFALGSGTDERVFALTVYNGELIVGGRFLIAGGIPAVNIAKWNGSWANVGNPNAFSENAHINALTVFNSQLIVGGGFHLCDNIFVSRITAWDGSFWLRMTTGMNDRVKALYVYNNNTLYSGGEFTTAGGRYINHIAKWGIEQVVNVSGLVRFADNNDTVRAGKIKILRLDVNTREVIVVDSANILNNGTYLLPNVTPDSSYRVLGFPDDELDNFVPTYHPSATDWQSATPVHTIVSQNNININVYRISPGPEAPFSGTISGMVFLNIIPPIIPPSNGFPFWKDGIVYIKQGILFRKFAVSSTDRSYITASLSPGTYTLVASRYGYSSDDTTVTVGASNLTNINFYLDTINLTGLHNISSNVPKDYLLKQNYPNPFNPATTIGFSLPSDGFVELKIYDILGREIALLVNENLKKGEYKYIYDAGYISSGIYFYSLRTKEYAETKKMVLIK